jgi:pilus assembly protein CpaF
VLAPTAVNAGPYLAVRKFWKAELTLERLIEFKALDRAMVALLQSAILANCTVLVAGGTGSGKTTFLNTLTDLIPAQERIIAVEPYFELHLRHPRAINLCSDSSPDLTYGDLIKTATKMRPDRLIFTELHGPETQGIIDLLNNGYDGALATVHATSPEDALARLEMQCLTANLGLGLAEIRATIAAAFKVITYQQRLADGNRKVTEIVEVRGLQNDRYVLQPLVRYDAATEAFTQLAKPSWGQE